MKKFVLMLLLGMTVLFAGMDINTATKDELMNIKGIGMKKAQKIIEFRKMNKITKISDLQKIKGFGPSLIVKIEKATKDN